MTSSRVLVGAVAIALLLSGCESSVSADPTPTATESSTPSPTPTPTPTPVPAAIIVSRDALTVMNSAGGVVESAVFTDGDSVIALITKLTGAEPAIDDTYLEHKGFRNLAWADVKCTETGQDIACGFTAASIGELPLMTGEGIHVGSTRDEVLALNHFDKTNDSDGDGVGDTLGLEPEVVPDSQSLMTPGQPGTAFIGVTFTNDIASSLVSPDSDFHDL